MKLSDITTITDQELQKVCNELAGCFESFRRSERPQGLIVGFFQVSKELQRRGLTIARGRVNKDIVLVKQEQHGISKQP